MRRFTGSLSVVMVSVWDVVLSCMWRWNRMGLPQRLQVVVVVVMENGMSCLLKNVKCAEVALGHAYPFGSHNYIIP